MFVTDMNYKVYILIAILSISIALVGTNAALIRVAFSQTNLVTVKTDKTEYQKGNLIKISGKVETQRTNAEEPLLVQVFNPEGAAYRVDLVNVAANGSYNDKLNIGGQLGISGQYRVVVTYDKANEQSLFHFVSNIAPNGGNKTYNLNIGGKAYPLSYQITGGDNKLNSVTAEIDNTTLLLNTVAQSNGKLTIELPRNLIDSKKQGNTDEPYAVWEDGQPQAADEINTKNNSQVRTLTIDFDKGTGQIEIAGTKMVPEFGTVAIIIPAIAIIGIIIAGARYKQFSFRPRQ